MTNNPNSHTNKRTLVFGLILLFALGVLDFFLAKFSFEERKAQVVLETIQSDKLLSNELYRLFYSLEDDFNFIEEKIKAILAHNNAEESEKTLREFLNTHPRYFKVRLTDHRGAELFKIFQGQKRPSHEESERLFDLSNQDFFKSLSHAKHEGFYFSSMEANVINGKVEKPIRPTVRASKRITLRDGSSALLIFNIDGKKILQLFVEENSETLSTQNKALLDHQGFYIASHPLLNLENYTLNKARTSSSTIALLNATKEVQGFIEQKEDVIVFTMLPLPRSTEKWFVISTIPESSITTSLYWSRLTRLFWEILCFSIIVYWFWRDDKKRHKEQIIEVLLKERSEFIQNVSHQLKTPLTIIHNYLENEAEIENNKDEIKKEITHLIKVVEDLLLLSHIDSLHEIPLEEENILEILNEAISLVATKAMKKFVHIRLNVQEELIDQIQLLDKKVLPDLLKSAIFNILDNAVDFSPLQGMINISVSYVSGIVIVSIEDQGPGVPVEMQGLMFQRYSRDTNKNRKGSGLGLAITKKIIELHNGEIRFIPKPEGACFQISL